VKVVHGGYFKILGWRLGGATGGDGFDQVLIGTIFIFDGSVA
jgi:hypothetical protein